MELWLLCQRLENWSTLMRQHNILWELDAIAADCEYILKSLKQSRCVLTGGQKLVCLRSPLGVSVIVHVSRMHLQGSRLPRNGGILLLKFREVQLHFSSTRAYVSNTFANLWTFLKFILLLLLLLTIFCSTLLPIHKHKLPTCTPKM